MNIKELIKRQRELADGLREPACEQTAKALLAQQVVIGQMLEALREFADCAEVFDDSRRAGGMPNSGEFQTWPRLDKTFSLTVEGLRNARSAIALQPDLTALREHDAEVCQEFANFLGIEKCEDVVKWIGAVRKGE